MGSDGTPLGALVKSARERAGMSLADLAKATYVSRGWINNVEAGRRWPPREWVLRAGELLNSRGPLLSAWDHGENQRQDSKEVRALLGQSVRESQFLLELQPDAADLEQLHQAAAELGVEYLASPARPMLKCAVSLRKEVNQRLARGSLHSKDVADIHVTLARLSGVLAYAAVDLGNSKAAAIHGRAAFHMADLAGDDGLKAWSRGTQSLIARFDQNYRDAEHYLLDGMRHSGAGTSEIRLLCGLAQVAAHHGDTARALELITEAERARDRAKVDTVEGLFGFSPAKQAYYSGSSLMWLPERPVLEVAAEQSALAVNIWESEPSEQRSLDDEALAYVYLATARLQLGEIDGAMEAVRPVIDLPEDRQISWIRKRIGNLASLLGQDRYKGSRQAVAARDELSAYGMDSH